MLTFRIQGDQNLYNSTTKTAYETVKQEWLGKIGKNTSDGDFVRNVTEIGEEALEIELELLNPKNLNHYASGDRGNFYVEGLKVPTMKEQLKIMNRICGYIDPDEEKEEVKEEDVQ